MSEKDLSILAKNKVSGTPLKTSTYCLLSKQHRAFFHNSDPRSRQNILDLFHFDFCMMGPLQLAFHWRLSSGDASYFVTFIDDNPTKLWAYCFEI